MNPIFRLSHLLGGAKRKKTVKQSWLNERPVTIVVDDQQLPDIPVEGITNTLALSSSKLTDQFFVVKVNNQAVPFVTTSGNGTFKPHSTVTFTLTYKNGYDERDVLTSHGYISGNKLIIEDLSDDLNVTLTENHSYEHPVNYTDDVKLVSNINMSGAKLTDRFYVVTITNKATTILTNVASTQKYKVNVGGSFKLTMTLASGYESDALDCTGGYIDDSNCIRYDNLTGDVAIVIDEREIDPTVLNEEPIVTDTGFTELSLTDRFFCVNFVNNCPTLVTLAQTKSKVNVGSRYENKFTFIDGYDPYNITVPAGSFVFDETNNCWKFVLTEEETTQDYTITIDEKIEEKYPLVEEVEVVTNTSLINSELTDRMFYIYFKNNTSIVDYRESELVMSHYDKANKGVNYSRNLIFSEGYGAEDIKTVDGYLEVGAIKYDHIDKDLNFTLSLEENHLPNVDADSDLLGILDDTTFANMNQYRIITPSADKIIKNYVFISDCPTNLTNYSVWMFNDNLTTFDRSLIPGNVLCNIASTNGNANDVVTERVINGVTMYRHVVTFNESFVLTAGKSYIFPVRSAGDTSKIAVDSDTTISNIVNISNMPVLDSTGQNYVIDWSDAANTYICCANANIYFAINEKRV